MPVNPNQVTVGAVFITKSQELRKVTGMPTDAGGHVRVEYVTKSANPQLPGREFAPTATKHNPALLGTFAEACDHILSAAEMASLRQANVILSYE